MAARDDLGVVGRAEELDRVLDRLGDGVVEGGRDHRCASQIAVITRSGVKGRPTFRTPRWLRASTTAFPTAAGAAMVPPSPMPFTPIGLVGLGVTQRPSSNCGSSAADGTR